MPAPHFLSILLCLLTLLKLTTQVDISIVIDAFVGTCLNISPGQCCAFPDAVGDTQLPHSEAHALNAHGAVFTGLFPNDIAAVYWQAHGSADGDDNRPPSKGCSSRAAASKNGPGSWIYRERVVSGASFVRMPRAVPVKEEEGKGLRGEGVLGLEWNKGTWFASSDMASQLERLPGVLKRSRLRKGLTGQMGKAYIGPPPGMATPTVLSFNDTRWTAESVGSVIFRNDETGEVLNLTAVLSS